MISEEEKTLALSWSLLEVVVEKMEETPTSVIFWVSVPEFIPRESVTQSFKESACPFVSGSGMVQALSYMMNVTHPVGKGVIFNHTVRIGETWTAEKGKKAVEDMSLRIRSLELFGNT